METVAGDSAGEAAAVADLHKRSTEPGSSHVVSTGCVNATAAKRKAKAP